MPSSKCTNARQYQNFNRELQLCVGSSDGKDSCKTDGRNPWVFIPLLPIPAFSSLVSAIPANFYPCIFLSLHFHPCKHQSLQIAIPAFLSLQAAIPANCYPWKNKSCIFSTLVSPNHQSQFYHSKTHPTAVSQSFQYITHT